MKYSWMLIWQKTKVIGSYIRQSNLHDVQSTVIANRRWFRRRTGQYNQRGRSYVNESVIADRIDFDEEQVSQCLKELKHELPYWTENETTDTLIE